MSGNVSVDNFSELLNQVLAHDNIINRYLDKLEQKTSIKKHYIVQGKTT